jgi:TonB family protein
MKTLMRQGAARLLIAALSFVVGTHCCLAQDATQASRKVVVKTQAVYPTLAKSMNIHGVVKLTAVVLPNGAVKSVEVKGGHPLLTQSAVTAVGHWKFEPEAKETTELIEVKFDAE